MEQDTGVQEDRYFDPQLGMEVTHSGKARWAKILKERDAQRDHAGVAALREQLRSWPQTA